MGIVETGRGPVAQRGPGAVAPAGFFQRQRARDRQVALVMWVFTLVGSLVFLIPFYLMVVMSFKTPAEATNSPWTLPSTWVPANYVEAWQVKGADVNFFAFTRNTLLIAVLSTLGVTLSSALVAFGFARLRFPGRDRLFVLLLATMMLPGIVTMIPSFVLFAKLGWVNTFLPLILPAYFGGAFFIFLLRQFFLTLPPDLDEAARLDGATWWQVFWNVLLPLTKPALATVGIFAFIGAWKDFMGPLIYLNSTHLHTLELGLRTFQTIRGTDWNLMMAASVMVTLPLLAIFFLGQRYFVQGIVLTGLKG